MINGCKDCYTEIHKKSVRCPVCSAIERSKRFPMPVHNISHTDKTKALISKKKVKSGIAMYRNIVKHKKCQRCGSDGKINVHHIDRNRYNNDLSNLEVLCTKCHAHEHKNWLAANNTRLTKI